MRKLWLLAILAVVAAPVAATFADDLDPPVWRGNAGTSWAAWEFLQDNRTPPPDAGYLPYGAPSLVWTPGTGAEWFATNPPYNPPAPAGQGWLNLSGDIDVTMQDSNTPNPFKTVWIQLTWSPQSPGNVPFIQLFDPTETTTETSNYLEQTTLFDQDPNNPSALKVYHTVYHIDLQPNPPWERIHIRGGINVDELVIDTYCVPEPASLSSIVLAGVALLRRRR